MCIRDRKQMLLEIYESFQRENRENSAESSHADPD